MNLFELYATIALNDNGFSKGISEAKNQTESFGSKVKNLVNTVAGIKLVSVAFDAVRNSVGAAFDRIDTMEQFNRTMTVLSGSSEKADKALDSLRDIVTGTAYGLDVAAKSTQSFVTSGMDIGTATGHIEGLANAVSFYGDGTNATLDGVTNAWGKMATSGKVYAQDVKTLLNAGIPVWEIYAEAVGMSVEEVQEATSSGAIKAEEFQNTLVAALESGAGKFPSVADAAKTAGASWAGTFDNMRAATTRGVQEIIAQIDDNLAKKGMPSIRESLLDTAKRFEQFLKTIAEVAGELTSRFAPAIKVGIDLLGGIMNATASAVGVIAPLTPVILGSVAAFKAYEILTSVGNKMLNFVNSIKAIKSATDASAVSKNFDILVTNKSTAAAAARTASEKAMNAQIIANTAATKAATLAKKAEEIVEKDGIKSKTAVKALEASRQAQRQAEIASIKATTLAKASDNATAKASVAAKLADNAMTKESIIVNGIYSTTLSSKTAAEALNNAAKKVGMTITAEGVLVTKAGTVATTQETAALLISSGAMSAKSVIAGVLTGNIGAVTAAQWLWNAAIAANPIGAVVAGVVVLTGVVVALAVRLNKVSDETKELIAENEKLIKSTQELTERIEANSKAYKDRTTSINAETGANEELLSKIKELINSEDDSAEVRKKVATYVDLLNESMEGLNLQYDIETGLLNQSIEAIDSRIEALNRQLRAETYREYALKAVRDQIEAEEKLNEISDERENILSKLGMTESEVNAELGKSVQGYSKLTREQLKMATSHFVLGQEQENLIETLSKLEGSFESFAEKIEENTEKINELGDTTLTYQERVLARQQEIAEARAKAEEVATFRMIKAANRYNLTLDEYKDKLKEAETLKRQQLDETYNTVKRVLDGEISALSKAHSEREDMYKKAFAAELDALNKSLSTQLKNYQKALDDELKAFERVSNAKIALIDAEYVERLKLIDEEKYNQLKAIDEEIDGINAVQAAEEQAAKERENEAQLAELRAKVLAAETAEQRKKAAEDLAAFERNLADEKIKEGRRARINALNEQKTAINEEAKAKSDALKAEIDQRKTALQEQISAEKEVLKEVQSERLEAFKEAQEIERQGMKDSHDFQLEALRESHELERDNMQSNHEQRLNNMKKEHDHQMELIGNSYFEQKKLFNEMFGDIYGSTHEMGGNAGQGFIDGFSEKTAEIERNVSSASERIVEAFSRIFEFGSPSKLFKRFAKWTAQGYGDEFTHGVNDILVTAKKFTGNLVDAFKGVDLDNLQFPNVESRFNSNREIGVLQSPNDRAAAPIYITQNIETVPLSPYETAQQTANMFNRLRWSM